MNLQIQEQKGLFTLHRLSRDRSIPPELFSLDKLFIGKTEDELSILCEASAFESAKSEPDFRCLKVLDDLPFDLAGILAEITSTCAKIGIPVLANSTFDTDYIFFHKKHFDKACKALEERGHELILLP